METIENVEKGSWSIQRKINVKDEFFKMDSTRIHTFSFNITVKNGLAQKSNLELKIGPLDLDGKQLQKVFVIEVDWQEAQRNHASQLPLLGFGSHLMFDYDDAITPVVEKFCKHFGLKVHHVITTMPNLQIIVESQEKCKFSFPAVSNDLILLNTLFEC